jgi:hypothetical protein
MVHGCTGVRTLEMLLPLFNYSSISKIGLRFAFFIERLSKITKHLETLVFCYYLAPAYSESFKLHIISLQVKNSIDILESALTYLISLKTF